MWVPRPVLPLFNIDSDMHDLVAGLGIVNIIAEEEVPASDNTNELVKEYVREAGWIEDVEGGVLFETKTEVLETLETMSLTASAFSSGALLRGPTLELRLLPPSEWLAGQFVEWRALDALSGESLPCRSEQPDLAQSAPTARDHIGMGARIEWVYGHTPRFSEVLRTRWMAMTSAVVRRSGGSSSGAFGCSACHCFR